MDKSFIKKVLAVVLGISLFVMLVTLASLIMEAALADDVSIHASFTAEKTIMFIKWSAVALICVTVPALVCYALAYFGNHKIFGIISEVLSFLIVACCIAFFVVARKIALEQLSSSAYASATGYFTELIQLAVPSLLVGIYFVLESVKAFKKNGQKEAEEDEEV